MGIYKKRLHEIEEAYDKVSKGEFMQFRINLGKIDNRTIHILLSRDPFQWRDLTTGIYYPLLVKYTIIEYTLNNEEFEIVTRDFSIEDIKRSLFCRYGIFQLNN